MSEVPTVSGPDRFGWSWQIGLWHAQVVLALIFGLAGAMKTFASPHYLVTMGIDYANDIPNLLLRLIGEAELAGAFGMVLPALTRIKPFLTPSAALGFATIQVLAIAFHIARGEFSTMAPINLILLALSLFVLWGRTKKAPIMPCD